MSSSTEPAGRAPAGRPRRILISGGTSGIGEACAARLAGHKDLVWVLGSRPDKVTAMVSAHQGLAGASVCDVTDEAAVDGTVADAARQLGGLDGVFVNAGIDGQGARAPELDVAHFRRVLEVNVLGAFAVARAALRVLARPGTIVFNASVNALRPEAGFTDYNASKAAVVSMAKTMALELSREGIAVMALCPGYFPTPMTAAYLDDQSVRAELLTRIPAGRFGALPEIAEVVDFLLSPAAAYLTGSVISLDGGASA
jgi:NAD(P)-dependent dehydrogenase (short-subunit alcohol dehydrogenase family)